MEASKNKELYLGMLGIAIWETQIWVKMRLFGGRESVRGLCGQKSQVCQSCLARIMIDSDAESTTKKTFVLQGQGRGPMRILGFWNIIQMIWMPALRQQVVLLYLKWITSKDLLYSTWNCSLLCGSLDGRRVGERIHLHIWLDPFTLHLTLSQHC